MDVRISTAKDYVARMEETISYLSTYISRESYKIGEVIPTDISELKKYALSNLEFYECLLDLIELFPEYIKSQEEEFLIKDEHDQSIDYHSLYNLIDRTKKDPEGSHLPHKYKISFLQPIGDLTKDFRRRVRKETESKKAQIAHDWRYVINISPDFTYSRKGSQAETHSFHSTANMCNKVIEYLNNNKGVYESSERLASLFGEGTAETMRKNIGKWNKKIKASLELDVNLVGSSQGEGYRIDPLYYIDFTESM